MSRQPLDANLAVDIDSRTIVCRNCDGELCDADENYKLHALCERKPVAEAGPLVNDPTEYVDDELEFRQYYCPSCATLLTNEVIQAELEPIHDKQLYID
ncbi:acetone carboxylase subunit gamma [Haladaptatus sp. NG-SE-30]